jgi:hypothetical protein
MLPAIVARLQLCRAKIEGSRLARYCHEGLDEFEDEICDNLPVFLHC